jgi:hypothetical protein
VCYFIYSLVRKRDVNGEVHGGRPRPTGAVVPRKKRKMEEGQFLGILKYN